MEALRVRDGASVEELAELLRVSKMTVHRDLDRLAELRLVRKIRGGATLLSNMVFEADLGFRTRQHRAEKQALARRVADLVEPGMALILDDSSTTAAILPFLPEKRPLTIITSARPLINALAGQDGMTLMALGGRYDPISDAFFGILCETSIARLRADLGIFSTPAVHGAAAYLHDADIVRIKLAMMAAADRSVMAFDASKFGKPAINHFTELSAFEKVFVPDDTSPHLVQELERAKVQVETVPLDSGIPEGNVLRRGAQ